MAVQASNAQLADKAKLVTIFGGSGFVGRAVVRTLARQGYRIRIAVRRPTLAGYLQPLGDVGQIHAVQANIRNEASVNRAVDGADIVINLTGILVEGGAQQFEAIHHLGARTVAKAAAKANVRMLIHMSAIGASSRSKSLYARTKARGEADVLAAFPHAIIMRPSIIFGPEDDFFNRFATMATMAPFLPLIGGGKTAFQPVYVGDVAAAISAAIAGRARPGAVYELGGPKVYSFKELMQLTLTWTGRKKRLLPIPFLVAKLMAFFMKLMPNPPLTVDQIRLLRTDNVVSREASAERRTLEALGITPQRLEAIVPGYLRVYHPKGQFAYNWKNDAV